MKNSKLILFVLFFLFFFKKIFFMDVDVHDFGERGDKKLKSLLKKIGMTAAYPSVFYVLSFLFTMRIKELNDKNVSNAQLLRICISAAPPLYSLLLDMIFSESIKNVLVENNYFYDGIWFLWNYDIMNMNFHNYVKSYGDYFVKIFFNSQVFSRWFKTIFMYFTEDDSVFLLIGGMLLACIVFYIIISIIGRPVSLNRLNDDLLL